MVQFLPINFFSWIYSIFVVFFKRSRFFVSLCTSAFLFSFFFLIVEGKYSTQHVLHCRMHEKYNF